MPPARPSGDGSRRGTVCENGEFRTESRQYAHNCPRGRVSCLCSRKTASAAVLPNSAQGYCGTVPSGRGQPHSYGRVHASEVQRAAGCLPAAPVAATVRAPARPSDVSALRKSNARRGARLQRLPTGSPLPALLVDRVAPVSVFSALGAGDPLPGHRRHGPWGLGGTTGGEVS